MINRSINLPKSQSFFLFGARGTGKSTLLRARLEQESVLWLDLLEPEEEALFQRNPSELSARLSAISSGEKKRWVVIDEIQKVPALLDVVHQQIEKKRFLFALTGSSARKLKRGGANLLAGRAVTRQLFPFTAEEIRSQRAFDLNNALRWGTLPHVFDLMEEVDRADFLRSYATTYLKEEVVAEQLVRNVAPFRAFLEIAAQSNGKILNYSKIARDASTDPVSVQSYFEILEETWLGFLLPPFHESVRKRQRKNPKFYFFDPGVKRALSRTLEVPLRPGTSGYGEAFEHWVVLEIHRSARLFRPDWELFYLRTKDDAEIDLILDRPGLPRALIEIKSADSIQEEDLSSFKRFASSFSGAECFCLSRDPNLKRFGPVHCLPWNLGLIELGLSPGNESSAEQVLRDPLPK